MHSNRIASDSKQTSRRQRGTSQATEIHAGPSFTAKTAGVTVVSVIARGFGLLVPFAVAAWFGTSAETDILFFVYALVLFASNVLAPVLESVSVPFIAQRRGRGHDPAPLVTVLAVVAVAGAAAAALLLGTLTPLLLTTVTSFSDSGIDLASRLVILALPLVPLTSLSGVFAGALNANGKFLLPASSPLVRALINLTVIAVLRPSHGVSAVILGYVAGEAARACLLALGCLSSRLASIPLRNQGLRADALEFLRIGGFQATGMLSIGMVPLIDRAMASWLSPGSVTLLEYSDRLYQIPVALIGSGLVVTSLSRWSTLLHTEGFVALRADVRLIVGRTFALAVAVSLVFGIATPFVVRLVYPTALSPSQQPVVVATVLAFMIGVAPFVAGQLYNRALLALKQTRFLLGVTIVANVLNIVFNVVMMRMFGVAGLALSSSATALGVVLVLRHRFHKITADALRANVIEIVDEGAM